MSVSLATLVWLLIHYNSPDNLRGQRSGTSTRCPSTCMTPATDAGTFSVEPPIVRLTVSGTPTVLERLRLTDLLVFVNLGSVPEVEAYRDVEVHVPAGCRLDRVGTQPGPGHPPGTPSTARLQRVPQNP